MLKTLFKKRWFWALALIVVCLCAVGFFTGNGNAGPATSTATVARGDLENLVTATGTLQPREYVDVGAQVSGQLDVLHVQVGDAVKKGDLLAEIDATVYAAKVDGTRAQLRNLQAQKSDREAQLKLAQITHKREQNLRKADATTEEALQSAEASLQSARAQLAMLEAQMAQTESSLRAEEANLEYARIYAPMDGTVVSVTARQGQTLNANQTTPTLLQIADLTTMTVQAQVSEADISKLSNGMVVYFTTLGSGGRRWYGTLERIEPTPTVLNNVVLYNALFDVPNERGMLLPQMTTQVFFVTEQAKDALLVPVTALTYSAESRASAQAGQKPARGQAGPRTATVTLWRNGKPEPREVQVGMSNRVKAVLLSGVEEGDEVVLNRPKAAAGTDRGWGRPPGFIR